MWWRPVLEMDVSRGEWKVILDVDDEDSIPRFVKNYLFYFLLSLKVLKHFENLGSHIFEKLYCVIDLVNGSLRFVIIYVFNGWGLG